MRRYVAIMLGVLERPAPAANEAGNELEPRVIVLSADARAAWISFYNGIEKAMASDGPLEDLRDVASKAAEIAARIAGVLTIIENPDASSIDAETMASARVIRYPSREAAHLSRSPPLGKRLCLTDSLIQPMHVGAYVEMLTRYLNGRRPPLSP